MNFKIFDTFLTGFSKSTNWRELKRVLQTYKENVESVNYVMDADAKLTSAEKWAGRQITSQAIEEFIIGIDAYNPQKLKKKDKRDNFN